MNSRITEYLGCNLPLEIIYSSPLKTNYIILVMILSMQDLNVSKDEDFTAALDKLFLCLTTITLASSCCNSYYSKISPDISLHIHAYMFICTCMYVSVEFIFTNCNNYVFFL